MKESMGLCMVDAARSDFSSFMRDHADDNEHRKGRFVDVDSGEVLGIWWRYVRSYQGD